MPKRRNRRAASIKRFSVVLLGALAATLLTPSVLSAQTPPVPSATLTYQSHTLVDPSTGWTFTEQSAEIVLRVNLDPAPTTRLRVNLNATTGGHFLRSRETTRTVDFAAGETHQDVTYHIDNDRTNEPHSLLTIRIQPGDGYTIGQPDNFSSIYLHDNDRPPGERTTTATQLTVANPRYEPALIDCGDTDEAQRFADHCQTAQQELEERCRGFEIVRADGTRYLRNIPGARGSNRRADVPSDCGTNGAAPDPQVTVIDNPDYVDSQIIESYINDVGNRSSRLIDNPDHILPTVTRPGRIPRITEPVEPTIEFPDYPEEIPWPECPDHESQGCTDAVYDAYFARVDAQLDRYNKAVERYDKAWQDHHDDWDDFLERRNQLIQADQPFQECGHEPAMFPSLNHNEPYLRNLGNNLILDEDGDSIPNPDYDPLCTITANTGVP